MEYQIIKSDTSPESIKTYSEFLSASYSLSSSYTAITKSSSEYLLWQYKMNPAGEFLGYTAYYENKAVGHFSCLPVLYSLNGRNSKGLLALNLVTHPDHRGKGLFIKMASKTFEDAVKLGYEFVIGVSNQNSTHGLINKLGFYLISPLQVKLGIGKLAIDQSTPYSLKSIWTEDFLNWRLANPSAKYFLEGTHIISPAGKPGIYAIMKTLASHSGKNPVLKKKTRPLKVWIGLANSARSLGVFVNMPKVFRPVPLNLIFKDLTGNIPKFNKEEVYFELFDFDAY